MPVKCRWCGQGIIRCRVTDCPGWQSLGCTGWEHSDLFHGCPGGQHCATALEGDTRDTA